MLAYLLTYCLARDDPSPLPWRTLSAQMGSRANAQYNWRGVEGREARAKALPIADPNPKPNPNPNPNPTPDPTPNQVHGARARVVTNDAMRDHRMDLLPERAFRRWRATQTMG